MKINDTQPLQRIPGLDQSRSSDVQRSQGAGGSEQAAPASVAHLNQSLTDTSKDIDAARVDEIRAAISEGRLEMDTDKIADALINSLGDLVGPNAG